MLVPIWINIGIGVILVILGVVGWVLALHRYSKNDAKHIGELGGTVDGLSGRIGSLEDRINNMETNIGNRLNSIDQRLDKFLATWPGNVSE